MTSVHQGLSQAGAGEEPGYEVGAVVGPGAGVSNVQSVKMFDKFNTQDIIKR